MKPHKILIVDDEPDNIRAIRNCIAESGEPYTLYQALNGELALKIAIAEIPDLVITDWEMPGMNGIELIRKIHQNKITTEIPVIMCTGVMTTSEHLHTALMAGAVDYIRKPIDKIELIARVKSMLELSDSRKELHQKYSLIKQNNKFIQTLIESIQHPFVYYYPDGTIKGCNHHFQNLLGMADRNLPETNLYDYEYFSASSCHREKDSVLLTQKVNLAYECELAGKFFILSKTLFYNSIGEPEGIMCIMTDITEMKQAHHEIVESKKRELTSNAIRLINISEMNNSLIADLEKIHDQPNEKKSELIRNITNRLCVKSHENIWNEFDTHFRNVFDNFYKTINQQFPDLTPGELKLCAFLRLNLSSKEIAALTFQNPKSIDQARYRLRKKMNLDQDDNLTEFLVKIN
jgi:CheY-like chemotaxis protein/DNA-binding CsgD family transcriptional regulator